MASINKIFRQVINVNGIVIDDVECTEEPIPTLTVYAHVRKGQSLCCPKCKCKCPGYDTPPVYREWRTLDFNGIYTTIRIPAIRIRCPEHGVLEEAVPWAFYGSKFTKAFEYTATWLGKYINRTAISKLERIAWRTVGSCIDRVHNDLEPDISVRFDGLVNIGVDETSCHKGHNYITVVVDHDRNSVVWAHEGHSKEVFSMFFEALTPEQRMSIRTVSGDGAKWIDNCIEKYVPQATRCLDPFHVVGWATDALNDIRKEIWNELRNAIPKQKLKRGRPSADDLQAQEIREMKERASAVKHSQYALGKAPENLTENQEIKLQMIQIEHPKLYRAYLLKERLRMLLKISDRTVAEYELDRWIRSAQHCRIPQFIELQRKIRRHKEHILNTIEAGISNARNEATNNKIQLLIRIAFGFHDAKNLISMLLLYFSDIKIPLPNRGMVQWL